MEPSSEGDDRERSDLDNQTSKPIKGPVLRVDPDSGVGEGSRGIGS